MKYLALVLLLFGFQVQAESDHHLIYVNGLVEKNVAPNMISVQVESWAKAASAQKAQEQQALQLTQLKKSIERFKIKSEDVQTTSYSVSPEYTYDQKTQVSRITGYRASHSLVIVYRKVEDAGYLVDAITASAKNDNYGVSVLGMNWDYEGKAEVESAALAEAVKNARTRADELARAAGVNIVGVHKIQHVTDAAPLARPILEKAMMRVSADGAAPATELSGGQIKIRVEVQMEFEI